eukprot:Skav231514  [mRNA]  locus=scaffold84:431761:435581:- [translate_table: standard]
MFSTSGSGSDAIDGQDLHSQQPCAVKQVRYKGGAGVETQVIREAQVLCAMDHPNIVKCSHAWIQPEHDEGMDG